MANAQRNIPAALQAHLDGYGTTLAYLLKIVAKDGTVIGVTSHDVDLDYDDGGGSITYQSAIGLETSAIDSTSVLDVDNLEAKMLVVDSSDFTEQKINAGVLDFADFWIYRVNFDDLAAGHYIVLKGTTGAVRSMDGLAGVVELRGLSQGLKQTASVELYSITCRARFGSQDGEERQPCFFDTTSLWSSDTILSVDSTEPDRIFTATTTPAATGPGGALPFVPGIVKFTSGANAGLTVEIEDVVGDEITLRFQTPYDIQAGDTYDIRPDCAKRYVEDCIGLFDNGINFRGEPYVTAGDEASQVTPGATYPVVYSSVPKYEEP
jgi:uncharacterized phage protein (TIGR02218 family)